ncbi:glycosyltransferase family 4 protein [Paraburkholderia sp. JPY432]|uniref:glycosyltransferase family 4 protein n=1 Tax=Paraburkholderia TaxID=1822464 RepID=UPI001595BAEC|nr:glycosyltransferase family 4 protein [Paraburkholderia youngii]NVH77093.1 glycosyltransferase family 4 protein [Paraburkholderia youngii]
MSVPILYIASRPFIPAAGGRENMIFQSLQFLENQHKVSVVIFKGKNELVDLQRYYARFPKFRFHLLDLPTAPNWILEWIITARPLPLQVAMYLSRSGKRLIRSIIDDQKCKLVIADMLRTSMLFQTKDCISVVELDDLLSVRYLHNIRASVGNRLLGTYEDRMPAFAAKIANRFSRTVLRYERWAISRMERNSATRHNAVVFVSHAEAALFKQMTGADNVYAVPPTTKIRKAPDRLLPSPTDRINLMFFGNMHTTANRQSLRYVLESVLPALTHLGVDYRFHAIGRCPPELIARYQRPDVFFTGFLDNPDDLFDSMHIHIAPMFGGTGIKTKILESLARGIPTITTADGVIGMSVESGRELFICADANEIALRCVDLARDANLYRLLSKASARFASEQFNFDINRNRYLDILRTCLAAPVAKTAPVLGGAQ